MVLQGSVPAIHSTVKPENTKPFIEPDARITTNSTVPVLEKNKHIFFIEGVEPTRDMVLDTGSRDCMIGLTMAKQLGITKADLDPGEEYLTSSRQTNTSLGVTKRDYEITIGQGKFKTTVPIRLTLSPFDKYSILPGNAFIVPIGVIVGSWGHRFHYRVNWEVKGDRMVSVPIITHGLNAT